jgi:DNA-binding response OmpR family regulator
MMDPHMPFPPAPLPFASSSDLKGLQGLIILAVEDSRFASDALRLMSQRSGARLRRAEGVEAAREHLAAYRPDVVLVDLGLPDGRGEDLIADLVATPGPPVIGMSGDPEGRAKAMTAGAASFLEKPIPSLMVFQQAILIHLPDCQGRAVAAADTPVRPDRLALWDDLASAAYLLRDEPGPDERAYLSGFLSGIARQMQDPRLSAASAELADPQARLEQLNRLLQKRLADADPFAVPG